LEFIYLKRNSNQKRVNTQMYELFYLFFILFPEFICTKSKNFKILQIGGEA